MAVGASGLRLFGLVVRDGLKLVAIGVFAGVFVTVDGSRVLRGLLCGIEATDIATYMAASLVLISIALTVAWIGGRRAVKVDPMIAMRPE
jgi:putative ABC transport system permease protein